MSLKLHFRYSCLRADKNANMFMIKVKYYYFIDKYIHTNEIIARQKQIEP